MTLSETRPTVTMSSVSSWVTLEPSGRVTMSFGMEGIRRKISGRLGLFNQFAKLTEEVGGIVRPWRGLRVILHAEDCRLAVAHSLDGLVVEVDVRDLDIGREGL